MTDLEIVRDYFLNKNAAIQVFPATVKEVGGNTCTVELLSTEMEVPGVRLVADQDAESVVITPAVGSYVLIGCIENDVSNAFVCQYSEIERIAGKVGSTEIDISGDRVTVKNGDVSFSIEQGQAVLKQGAAEITLNSSKVSVKNAGVSLKDLFDSLTQLLNTFVVITPNGPSTGLSPTSTLAVAELSTKANLLLS